MTAYLVGHLDLCMCVWEVKKTMTKTSSSWLNSGQRVGNAKHEARIAENEETEMPQEQGVDRTTHRSIHVWNSNGL